MIIMEKQLVYYLFVLLLVQSCHVQAQRPLLDVTSSVAHSKSSSMSSEGDSYETLLLGKPSSMSSEGDSDETLLLGKPSSMSSEGDSDETLLLGKPSSMSSRGDLDETLLLGKPSSMSSKGYETLLLGKPSSMNSKGDYETLLLGKPSSMNSKGDSSETLLLGKPSSTSSKDETLLLGKPSSMSSKGDSYETLSLGLYIAIVAIMVARVVFEIVKNVSAFAKASRVEEKQSSKLKSMDIEMGVEPEAKDNSTRKPILYSPEVVKEATQGFSPKSHIAGSVYRGIINGRDVVIKQMKENVSHEMKSLQKVEHDNLVKLQGFCINCEGKSYLIYEYVDNESLNLWLHRPSVGFQGLTWRTRLQIALDVATGLNHIHERTGIVHRNLKSSNVLLNRKLRAKVANFGAARYMVNSSRHVRAHGVSPKIDVFAFGVILLKLISGKEAMIKNGELRQIKYLLEGQDREEKLRKWIDPNVQDTCSIDSAISMALLAKACLDEDVEARPTMREIVYRLSDLLDVCFEHLECS
ncbi:serine/threonine receptor-like kinase NFP [Cryptomeria japonica]|uniref:serine/threonine receptor-like kinase NFP n=1 Tax=Cryptomeria japonica TaxID=3369 RepID=UPI0027DA3D60|nr:serine/threonine receptor-like kinase NFP [Cryptomeria japonica]